MTSTAIVIATRDFEKYSETFVRRHVSSLFDGKTALILSKAPSETYSSKSFHVTTPIRAELRASREDGFVRGVKKRVRRDRITARSLRFIEASGASAVLCEFGYVATEMLETIERCTVPVFCYFRGYDASKKLQNPDYRADLYRIFPRLTGVIAVSQYLLDRLGAVGLKHENTLVVPSGIDTQEIHPSQNNGVHLVTVGRLVEKKDPFTALAAFQSIVKRHPLARWSLAGDGPLREELEARVEQLGISDRVDFLGAIDHRAALKLISDATAYFQAFKVTHDGDSEGLPSVLQEAMASGKPIVTTKHAGIPEIIKDGETGLLHCEGDSAGIADSLDRILSDAGLRYSLGAAARTFAERNLDYRLLYRRLESFIGEHAAMTPPP